METAATKLLIERLHAHGGMPVVPVLHGHAPRLTANRAVLDVLLVITAAGIERHRVRFAAVRAGDDSACVGGAVAERKVAIEIELVGLVGLIVESESHPVTYCACAAPAPYN